MGCNLKYQNIAKEISRFCGKLEGKRILDVGCDRKGELITALVKDYQAKKAIGVNIEVSPKKIFQGCSLEKVDIRKSPFSSNYFDIIVSYASFEHIFKLDVALNEMFRILKIGGLLYTNFGPIWSSAWGHHLWISHDGYIYNYLNTILPPYCHLLMEPEDLNAYCIKYYEKELSAELVDYIYNSPKQNRLFFEDYEKLVNNCLFEVLCFHGSVNHSLSKVYHVNFPETLGLLHEKYPKHKKFLYSAICLLLRKAP